MKKLFLFILILLSANLFPQTSNLNSTDSIKTPDSSLSSASTLGSKIKNINSHYTSSKNSGILIGSLVGAAAGIAIGPFLGSFSMEPTSDKKASLGTLILCGVFGAVIGGIIGGVTSK